MKHSLSFIAIATLLLASCSQPFKKADGGMEYKIISEGKGAVIKAGQFFEIQFEQRYKGTNKDTLLFSSKDFSNQIVGLDSSALPPVYYKIFTQVRKGDSIIVKQLTDSLMKQGGQLPPFFKKGGYIIANYKIVDIFTTREAADSAYKVQMIAARTKDSIKGLEQIKKDDIGITDYLAKNNIKAIKGTLGTYVQIINPGEGNTIDTSNILKIMYTGKNFGGETFDSNTDPKFNRSDALVVNMGAAPGTPGSVIRGMTDGLSLLKKGAKAVLYIPSALAYGSQGSGAQIKPNENLLFEVEIVDVISATQAKAEEAAQRMKMEAMQKKMMDSMQKAQANNPAVKK